MATKIFRGMSPFSQLLFSFFVILVTFLIVFVLSLLVAIPVFGADTMLGQFSRLDYSNPGTIRLLKYMQTVQSLGLFLIPPIIIAWFFSGSVKNYLLLNGNFKLSLVWLAFLLIIVANPAINFMGSLNENMRLPEWMSGLEARMKAMEENAALLLDRFMDVKTTGALLFNLLMIAVIPAIGEEFLFRGVVQKIFTGWARSHHWGIWISAILFSALHLQFYGFVPRMALGALFGYLLVWSGSMWVPVLAHFFNNAVGVFGLFLIRKGSISPEIEDIGSGQLPIAVASMGLTILLLYLIHKQKNEKEYR
ncbi:MAG: CPBP family intramembrane glutamic endopeptidase [Prolixibacteraceae bacterium]|jgi:membrane protease YdiL (CAAX protease family)|nr:CPBP family intramembrane glutamic endopeptidase [Prolixibacteraceae bacterium]